MWISIKFPGDADAWGWGSRDHTLKATVLSSHLPHPRLLPDETRGMESPTINAILLITPNYV